MGPRLRWRAGALNLHAQAREKVWAQFLPLLQWSSAKHALHR